MLTRTRPRQGITALRRFVRSQPIERCELCAAPIGQSHPHLLEPASTVLLCCCPVCASSVGENPDGRYLRIPERIEAVPEFRMSDAEWRALGVPVEMAWLVYNTPASGPVAFYPGPVGVTHSPIGTSAWSALVSRNPVLAGFAADVEALLVNRVRGQRAHYRVPIDRCYELAGLLRTHWRGWSGGDDVWPEIDDYFNRLVPAARPGERVA
jgi:hypothetical protein